jgi:hypothetical protein
MKLNRVFKVRKEIPMIKRVCLFAVAFALLSAGIAAAQQFPILDEVADKVVQKYQMSSCEQLWMQKSQPKTPMEEKLVQTLRNDPAMRAEFFRRVSAPIVTKMFECGMIP